MAPCRRYVRSPGALHPDRRPSSGLPCNVSDPKLGIPLLTGLEARHVIADKAYDSHAILDHIEASGAQPIIPQRTCMPRKRAFDPVKYKLRNRIERTIGKLKQLRRIATRYDRIPENYLASLHLAALAFW